MNRKEFLRRSVQAGLGSSAIVTLEGKSAPPAVQATPADELERVRREKEFIQNWLTDLLETASNELDASTQLKLIEGCGRGCYRRHSFKHDLVRDGKGNLENLMEALKRIAGPDGVWRDGGRVHLIYRSPDNSCYCPANRDPAAKTYALQCHCSCTSVRTIFEQALGSTVEVELLESFRRGDARCHFVISPA